MAAPAVVEDLDILEERLIGLLVSFVRRMVDKFTLPGAEKALDHRVVVAVAYATHTGLDLVLGQELAIWLAGVLDSAVAAM
jgi:hypothetical protein